MFSWHQIKVPNSSVLTKPNLQFLNIITIFIWIFLSSTDLCIYRKKEKANHTHKINTLH